MYCPECGTEVDIDASFCRCCGTDLEEPTFSEKEVHSGDKNTTKSEIDNRADVSQTNDDTDLTVADDDVLDGISARQAGTATVLGLVPTYVLSVIYRTGHPLSDGLIFSVFALPVVTYLIFEKKTRQMASSTLLWLSVVLTFSPLFYIIFALFAALTSRISIDNITFNLVFYSGSFSIAILLGIGFYFLSRWIDTDKQSVIPTR